MLNVLVAITFVSLVIGQTTDLCATLAPLYKSFGCEKPCPDALRYNCDNSPIKKNFKMDQCYFHGDNKYYQIGDVLPEKYHNQDNDQLCSYQCIAGFYGPSFWPINCVSTDKKPPLPCYFDTLYNMDSFYNDHLPMFLNDKQQCPIGWYILVTSLTSDDCSGDPHGCCKINKGSITLKVGRNFTVSTLKCRCNCPPFVECTI